MKTVINVRRFVHKKRKQLFLFQDFQVQWEVRISNH